MNRKNTNQNSFERASTITPLKGGAAALLHGEGESVQSAVCGGNFYCKPRSRSLSRKRASDSAVFPPFSGTCSLRSQPIRICEQIIDARRTTCRARIKRSVWSIGFYGVQIRKNTITFSVIVEMLNLRMRKRSTRPVDLIASIALPNKEENKEENK